MPKLPRDIPAVLTSFGFATLISQPVFNAILDHCCPVISNNDVCDFICNMALWVNDTSLSKPKGTAEFKFILDIAGSIDLVKAEWDLDVFVSVVKTRNPNIDFSSVLRLIDRPDFIINSQKGFQLIVDFYRKACPEQKKIPPTIFFREWNNPPAQFKFLALAASATPDCFNFSEYTEITKILSPDELAAACTVFPIVTMPNQSLNCLDVIATFVKLQKHPLCCNEAIQFIVTASEQSPELMLLGLSVLKLPWSSVHSSTVLSLIRLFLTRSRPLSFFVLKKLWDSSTNRVFLMDCFASLFHTQPDIISNSYICIRELNALDFALNSSDLDFALSIAVFAHDRDNFDLRIWLQTVDKNQLLNSAMRYVTSNIATQLENGYPASQLAVHHIFSFLVEFAEPFYPEFSDALAQLEADLRQDTRQSIATMSQDLEKISFKVLEDLFVCKITVEAFILAVVNLKNANSACRQEIYRLILKTFIDEARFMGVYPRNNLITAGSAMGIMIAENITTSDMNDMLFDLIIATLAKSPDDNKFLHFVLAVITRFLDRAADFSTFLNSLIEAEAIVKHAPDLLALIESKILGRVFTCVNPTEELIEAFPMVDPPDNLKEKISFIVNNLSTCNWTQKQKDVADLLTPKHVRWFCYYMVNKRAAIEPNFHNVYLMFLKEFKSEPLLKCLLYESLAAIRAILNSTDLKSDANRAKLKCLGSWLGGITVARDRPVLLRHFSFKQLLIEAVNNSRLPLILPFVCRYLECTQGTKIFKPMNPWISSLLSFLKEIYNTNDLDLNSKFEIELLLEKLDVDIESIVASMHLRDKEAQIPRIGIPLLRIHGTQTPVQIAMHRPEVQRVTRNPQTVPSSIYRAQEDNLPQWFASIVFNRQLPASVLSKTGRMAVSLALERSFSEILQQAVERSVTIGVISSRDLLLKDFALEPSEKRLKKAAHQMVTSLAGSLSNLTCREPLITTMAAAIRELFHNGTLGDANMADQAIRTLVEDNIDLGINMVRRAAEERAVLEIDERLSMAYTRRRSYQESSGPFNDLTAQQQEQMAGLSEIISLLPGGLTNKQFEFYEKYGPLKQSEQSLEKCLESFQIIMNRMQIAIESLAQLSEVPSDHELRDLITKVPQCLPLSQHRERVALYFCGKICLKLFAEDESQLGREIYAVVLRELAGQSAAVIKEIREYLLYSLDIRKCHVMATCAALKSGLVKLNELDPHLARAIKNDKTLIEYVVNVVNASISQGIASEADWLYVIDSMRVESYSQDPNPIALEFTCEMSRKINSLESLKLYDPSDFSAISARVSIIFAEWVRMLQNPQKNQILIQHFIQDIEKIILDSNEMFFLFFRTLMEISIDSWNKINTTAPFLAFQAIDAFAKMAVLVPLNMQETCDVFAKVISLVVLVITFFHETNGTRFNQRPYCRILMSILYEMRSLAPNDSLSGMYKSFNSAMNSLQPMLLPGFSYAWLHVLSNPHYVGPVLASKDPKLCWDYARHIANLLAFIKAYLERASAGEGGSLFMKAVFRLIIILLNDFPDFICYFGECFAMMVPRKCLQLRNLVLSAFPRGLEFPDPFSPEADVNTLRLCDSTAESAIDIFCIQLRANGISESKWDDAKYVLIKVKEAGNRIFGPDHGYDIKLIHAIITVAGHSDVFTQGNFVFFKDFIDGLDNGGKFHAFTGIANKLRYANLHTRYFHNLILWLFQNASRTDSSKEIIARVLVERLIANRPYPWGLLVTFLQLVRNPVYEFWKNKFIRSSPTIERIFQDVSMILSTES